MLRITRTEKSDEREGKAYACIAVNYVLRDFVRGPEHFIEVIGSKLLLDQTVFKQNLMSFHISPPKTLSKQHELTVNGYSSV